MPKMHFRKIKIITLLISIFFFPSFSSASPWAAVGDITLRNDVEILARYGVISGPVNTWPISWKQITRNIFRSSEMELPGYVRMAVIRVREKVPNEFQVGAKVQATNGPAIVRGFDTQARNDLDVEVIAEYNGDGGTTLHLQGGYRSGNGEEYSHLDGSYLSQDFGNWSAYLGAIDRWWGPGRESTLLLSNNARPMPSVGFRRVEPKAFETKWLSWIGPWQWDMFIAKMEENRHIPNALFVGMRFSFAPIKNFDIGVSRSIQLCGDGRPCGFNSWTKSLIAIGDLDNPTQAGAKAVEPGNQLASLDLSYSMSVGKTTNVKIYAEGTAEDLLVFLPYEYAKMVGLSFYGPYGDNGASWRLSSEFSDTISTLVWFGGRRRDHVIYNHHIYETGYRYKSRAIGHSLDSNSQLISLKAEFNSGNNWNYMLKLHHVVINKSGDDFYKSSVSATEETINIIEAKVRGEVPIGEVVISTRLYDDTPNTFGTKNAGVDVEVSWEVGF